MDSPGEEGSQRADSLTRSRILGQESGSGPKYPAFGSFSEYPVSGKGSRPQYPVLGSRSESLLLVQSSVEEYPVSD